MSNDVAQLIALTGLKQSIADALCAKNGNDFRTSLASFVQTLNTSKIDASCYDRPDETTKNGEKINDILADAYLKVRELVDKHGLEEPVAWKKLQVAKWIVAAAIPPAAPEPFTRVSQQTPAPKPAVSTSPFSLSAPANAKSATPAPPSAPTAANPSKSAFGATTKGSDSTANTGAASTGNPFKSAFASVAQQSTDPPKADEGKAANSGTFKSVFTSPQQAGSAAAASNPFTGGSKSVFGSAAQGASPFGGFKSVFGSLTTAPAAAPEKTPEKAVGTASVSSTKPADQKAAEPAASPFKFAFSPSTAQGKAAPAPANFNFGFSGTKPTEAAPASQSPQIPSTPSKPPVAGNPVKPTHFTGSFLEMPTFWKEEVEARAPLFNLDRGFMQRQKNNLRARLLPWVDVAGAFYRETPIQYYEIKDSDDDVTRVIIKDAERTFFAPVHRTKFVTFLHAMHVELGSYGQPLSFFAGLCLLGLTEQETAAVVRKVAKEYIPGHWAPEAVGFATNAWLTQKILKKRNPEIVQHFESLNFWPDTYLQKILSGLCVHVLSFDQLFMFLDQFIVQGFPFLVKFVLALVDHAQDEILQIKKPEKINELYEIMRLDSKAIDADDVKEILQHAIKMDVGDDLENLDVLRMQVYDDIIAPRLARAPKQETFEPCGICDKNKPTLWCEVCEMALCERCHAAGSAPHKKKHEVTDY